MCGWYVTLFTVSMFRTTLLQKVEKQIVPPECEVHVIRLAPILPTDSSVDQFIDHFVDLTLTVHLDLVKFVTVKIAFIKQ